MTTESEIEVENLRRKLSQAEEAISVLESQFEEICRELGIRDGSSTLQIRATIRRLRGGK